MLACLVSKEHPQTDTCLLVLGSKLKIKSLFGWFVPQSVSELTLYQMYGCHGCINMSILFEINSCVSMCVLNNSVLVADL